ncbi:MAG: hypothetical protein ACRDRH_02475 [Pseudonocardia sp.]
MNDAFHVQGRLIERRGPVVVRDETRRIDADSHDEAFRIAAVLRGDGFTVWVWAVDSSTMPAAWDLVERIEPPHHDTDRQQTQDVRRGAAQRARAGAA